MPRPLISPWLHRFALLLAAATFLLLGAGGLVTSHGSGMSVPDWPNTYDYNMFFFPFSRWVGGIFYEHTHRLLASGVGLLTTILAVWFYGRNARRFLRGLGVSLVALAIAIAFLAHRRWEDGTVLAVTGLAAFAASWFWPRCEASPRWLRWLGVAAFFGVVLQGVLGGLRVVLFKDQIGIFHAMLAQVFFALTCTLALFTSRWWQQRTASPHPVVPRPQRLFLAATLLILFQLALGATMRHQHAGLAIPDFPLAYGKVWPSADAASVQRYNADRIEVLDANPITGFQIELQMVHRLVALAILVTIGLCAWDARRRFGGRALSTRLAFVWSGLIVCQALLGAATIWTNKAADVATAHVLGGALALALGWVLSLVAALEPVGARRPANLRAEMKIAPACSFPSRPAPATGVD